MIKQLYGLIGKKLSHSFSPAYFADKFEKEGIETAEYRAFELEHIHEFVNLRTKHEHLKGLNVTIPYKEVIIPFLDDLSETATAVAAVNTIEFKDGQLIGHNTDVVGFSEDLKLLLSGAQPKAALLLGTGGAAKAVAYSLTQMGIAVQLVSRQATDNCLDYASLTAEIVADYPLIVNTTPLGMYPSVDAAPALPYEALGAEHFLYDLVYNPLETRFMQLGKAAGAKVRNGLGMLYGQAEAAWAIWNNL